MQDHLGQNLATKSVGGLKQWAIDYCVTKAGDYAIQLYSGGFVLDDEYRPRISAEVEDIPFDQEPLQVLVVGQVKSGKSSLINALLGEMRAPVDTLPATEDVDLYECRPAGLPRMILRDTPGYGAVADAGDPFSRLRGEIEECDLLLMVCTARSAARKADRELLHKIHELLPARSEATHAARRLRADARRHGAGASGCRGRRGRGGRSRRGRRANRRRAVRSGAGWQTWKASWRPSAERLPEAERLKIARCIRQIRKEQDEDKILRQILGGLRLTGGWMAGKTRLLRVRFLLRLRRPVVGITNLL